jgi:hypothetical protein
MDWPADTYLPDRESPDQWGTILVAYPLLDPPNNVDGPYDQAPPRTGDIAPRISTGRIRCSSWSTARWQAPMG